VSVPMQLGNRVALAPPRRRRAAPHAPRARRSDCPWRYRPWAQPHMRRCAATFVCVKARYAMVLKCACACMHACVCVLAAFPLASASCARACGCVCVCVCVCVGACVCVWVQRRCAGPRRGTAGTGGVYSAACDARTAAVCALRLCHRSVRLCARRRDVDEPYDQRAVGCAIWTHDRGRRRRRRLRHRRQRQHPLPGRVGEHRRRCGPDSRGVLGEYCG
jgi:hypothetical protein